MKWPLAKDGRDKDKSDRVKGKRVWEAAQKSYLGLGRDTRHSSGGVCKMSDLSKRRVHPSQASVYIYCHFNMQILVLLHE